MEDNNNPKQELWSKLNQAGYYTKDFSEFEAKYSTPESISSLYGKLNGAGYFTKSEDEFNSKYFSQPKGEEPVGGATSGQDSNAPTQPSSSSVKELTARAVSGDEAARQELTSLKSTTQSQPFDVDSEISKAKDKLDNLSAQSQRDGWTKEQFAEYSRPVVEHIKGLENLKEVSPEDIQQKKKAENLKVAGLRETALSNPKLKMTVDYYESAQRQFADESKFDLNIVGTHEKYTGKAPSQNIQERKLQDNQAWDKHKENMKRLELRLEDAKKKIELIVDPLVDSEVTGDNYSKFIMKGNSGVSVKNTDAIYRKADELVAKITNPSEPWLTNNGSESSFLRKDIVNKISAAVDYKILEPDAKIYADSKVKELNKKFGIDNDSPESIFQKESLEIGKIADGISNKVSAEAKEASDAVNNAYSSSIKQLQASADQYSAQMKIKQDQLVQAAQSGQINQLQYEAGINALNEEYKAGIEDIKSKGPSYDEYIKSINEINTRANRKYQDEIENAKKISTSKLEEKVKSIYGSEEYSNELKAIWGESFDKSQQKRFSDMKETEKIKELQILIGEGSFFQNSLTAVLPRFTSQTATSFGNAMKGFGVTLNNQALQEWGAYVGSKYEGSPVSTKAKDLLDPSNFAALSGQLLGGMAPSLAAGAVTAVATEGAGLGTAAQLVSSALAGFTTETAQIAGDAWDRMYQKTGSAADADEAYRKSINSQIDIAWAYAFDGLPFVKGALSKIESKAARVLAGSGIEFLTELIQEYPQNIAEENIMKQLDPWAGLSEKLTDVNKISETAVTLAPVALLGGAGQVGSKSRSQEIADAIIARESKASLSGVIEDQMDQYVQNITFAEGDKRARTVVAALMTAGHINESGLQRLNQVIDRSVQHNESAQKAGLNSSQRAVYSFFSSRADQATANAELYADDPIMSKMFRDQAKEYESAASDFLSNKPSDFYTVTYKDGTKIMLTSADAAKAFNDSTFLTQLADNKISVASYGKDTKIMDDLEAKAQVQKETNIKNKFNSIRAIWNKMDDISLSSNYDEKTRKQAKKQANALWKEMNKIKSSNPKINFYDTQNQPGVRGAERERETPIETQPNQGASTEAAQTSGVVQEPQEVEDKIQEEFKANGLDRLFPLDIDESTDEGKQLAKEKLAQQQAQDDIRAKYNVKSPINQSQEAKTGSNVAEVGQKPAVLEEGSTTTLPPQIQGATPRTMVFKDGTWQQQVGGTTTRVSEGVQAQAQQAFDQENDRIAQEEAAQEEMAHATLEEEQNAAAERESRLEEIRSVASDLTPGQIEDAADFMAARDITASEAVRHIRKRMSAEEEQQLDATVETMRKSFESAGISVEFGSTDNFDRGQGTRLTEGVFLSDDGRIIIDKSKLSKEWAKTVVFHEGTHPIINIIRNTNPELYAKVIKAKSKLEKLGLASIAGVKAFSESSVDKESSKESQVFTEEDEFIVELIARVASGKININSIPSESRSIIAQIINGIAKMLGMKPVMMDSDIVALKKLASDISRVLSTGADIAEIVGEDNTGRYRVAMSERSGTFETGETVYSGQARVTDVAEEIENPYRKSVNLPVKSLIDLLEEYGDNVIVVNSDPTGLGTVTLPSGKKIHLDGGIGYMAIQENIDAEVGFASSSDARVKFLNKKAIELRDAGKLKNGKVLVLVMVQKADSMLGNNYTPDYVADALAKIPKNIVSKQELSALLQEPFSKSSLIKFFTNQKSITSKTKPEKIPQIEEQNKKNMAKGLAKIEKIKSEIAALDPRSAHDRMIEIFHELNFVQAQAYFADILGNYTNKTTKYNKKLAQLLYKYAGADQKSLFKLLGEKSLIDKMLENPQDWGYAVAAFVHDTEKQKEKLKGIKHNLFNAKFQGGKRYILDKAYRINDLMVEFNKEQDEKVKKGKKKGAVYAEQQTSQGMYAVGKANIPKSKGVEFESLKSTEKRYQASNGKRTSIGDALPTPSKERITEAGESLQKKFRANKVPLSIDEAIDIIKEVVSWKDWYDGISAMVEDTFEEYAADYMMFMFGSAVASNSSGTIGTALNNLERLYKQEEIQGLPIMKRNIYEILSGLPITSDKISNFVAAGLGDKNAIPVDMHVWSFINSFPSTKTPSKKDFEKAKEFVRAVSDGIGWDPREVQAAMWAANMLRLGQKPDTYEEYIQRKIDKGLKSQIQDWRNKGYKPFFEVRQSEGKIETVFVQDENKGKFISHLEDVNKKISQKSQNTREEFSSNADETIARLKNAKEEDGATLNLDGTTYDGGGLVVPAGSVNVPQGKISADGLYDFLRDNEDKISSDIFKIGLYKFPDRSEVSYDLNIVIPREHREVALEFGKLSGQESLFDLDTYENIKTGSDGKNPRQFSGKELASIAKDLSEGRMPSVVQKSQGTRESIEGTYYESNMTEDGGDYIFFHVSGADKKALSKGIDSTKFNSLRTSREEKGLQYGVASFYTKPNDGERMVGGEKYVVRVPKDKVYPMDLDPNGYREVAEKKFPADTPFRKANIDKAVADMAKKAGFQMIVGEWNYSRTGKKTDLPEFRADALVSLKPTGEKSSEFESNEDKGMERVPHPDEAVLKAKGKLKDVANDIADYLSSKGKYNDAYQVANHYRNYGEVIVNRFEDNEFTRDMTKEDFDVMTNKLPKSLQSKASGIRESLPSANTGQKSEGNRESSSQALMEEIDAIIEKKGVDATMARRQFKETYGNESYDRAVKITRNFNQIIEALENKGIVKKQCP